MVNSDSGNRGDARVYDAALAQLKKCGRTGVGSIVVIAADGTEQKIALRTGTTRWQQAAKVITRMLLDGADRAEIRDEQGAVIDTIATETRPRDAKVEPTADPLERLLRLMLKAQEVALDRQSSLFVTAFATTNELVRGMVSRINQLESAHTRVLKAQWDAVTAQAEAEALAIEAQSSGEPSALESLAKAFTDGAVAKANGRGKPVG